jgi:glycosyltransferase involved in cell wall biosynthesis
MNYMNKDQPFVSVVFLSYCQEKYVSEALSSVLEQDYEEVEIIISDDASIDNTQNIISEVLRKYRGKKKIVKSFNEKNLGLTSNFNKALHLSSGDIIVVSAGDDISFRDRISRSVGLIESSSDIFMVAFSDEIIDGNGVQRTVKRRSKNLYFSMEDLFHGRQINISGASRAFKREVFDFFGELNDSCPTEDTPYLARALLLGNAVTSCKPGIQYRVHSESLSQPESLYKMDFGEIYRQHITDFHKAFNEGLVGIDHFFKLISWVDRVKVYRDADKDLFNANNKILFIICHCLISRKLTFNSRYKLFKSGLRMFLWGLKR